MQGQLIGSTIAAGFGLVYVLVNTGTLGDGARLGLCAAAVVAFAAVVASVVRTARIAADAPSADRGSPFGPAYWWVVIVEVIALLAGTRLLSGPLDRPEAGVAWVSFVVGVHFFALAVVFVQPFFHVLGAAVTLCGLAGLAIAFAGGDERWIDLVSGVAPGGLLLAAGWWGSRRDVRDSAPTSRPGPSRPRG